MAFRKSLRWSRTAAASRLALVVVVEIGGAGAREFDHLGPLAPMLESVIGNVPHKIAVVAFDSEPILVQGFTPRIEAAVEAVRNLTPGCTREHHQDFCQSANARVMTRCRRTTAPPFSTASVSPSICCAISPGLSPRDSAGERDARSRQPAHPRTGGTRGQRYQHDDLQHRVLDRQIRSRLIMPRGNFP